MKFKSISNKSKQAGFGKPAVILFLLLILSLLAAAYCFVEANLQTSRHHIMQNHAADFRNTVAQLVADSALPESAAAVRRGLRLGEKQLDGFFQGNASQGLTAIPDILSPEVEAVSEAWLNFVQALELSEKSGHGGESTSFSPDRLDTLSGLTASLQNWLRETDDRGGHSDTAASTAAKLALIGDIAKTGKPGSDIDDRQAVVVAWRSLKADITALQGVTDSDAAVLAGEMQAEAARLDSVIDPVQDRQELEASSYANLYAKNSELQLLLDKLQEGIGVLEHEQNYLFRLGVVAALFSLLFLFILAIVFWRDSENKIARSNRKNAANQRAILRLLDEITDLAEGDLSTRATVTEDITGAIADSVNYAVDTIRGLVITINHVSARVSTAAGETEETAKRLSRASNLQERETRRSSNYITAMAKTMKQMSGQAREAKDIASQSVTRAQSGSSAVSETVVGMGEIREQIQDTSKRLKRLGESSQQIGEIINLVNDIAERTNLLSLNAAIQASANGGHNSFSAVSEEVQRLAERVNEATRDIEGLIVTIQADTRAAIVSMELSTARVVKGSELAEQAGNALDEMQVVSRTLADRIQDISDKSDRQAEVTAKLSGNMKVISQIAEQTNEGLNSTTSSIEQLHAMAKSLTRSVENFVLPEDYADEELGADDFPIGLDRVDMNLEPLVEAAEDRDTRAD